MPKALKCCPKFNKSPNVVTLHMGNPMAWEKKSGAYYLAKINILTKDLIWLYRCRQTLLYKFPKLTKFTDHTVLYFPQNRGFEASTDTSIMITIRFSYLTENIILTFRLINQIWCFVAQHSLKYLQTFSI